MPKFKPEEAAQTEVSAEDIELGESMEYYGTNLDKAIQMIQKKHLDKYIAWPNRKEAQFRHNRWKFLKLIKEGTDVQVCESIDDADKTTDNVLAWRDRKIQDMFDAELRKKNIQSMRIQRMENSQTQAEKLNALGIHGVKASALPESET